MSFTQFKESVLNRPDRSAKGAIDDRIKDLCNLINSKDDYVTLSSCSGRIALTEVGRKQESQWIKVTHDLASQEKFKEALNTYTGESQLEFKQESSIIHIATRTLEQAQELIDKAARQCGFGRFGIISTKDVFKVELVCAAHISTPVFDNKLLITEDYLYYLIEEANKKMEKNWNAIERLTEFFKTINENRQRQ